MPDEEGKVLQLRVAANRRDWGDGQIEELTNALNTALEQGERIIVFVAHKGERGEAHFHTHGITRHNTRVSWLEMLAMLQIRVQQWYRTACE